jgi:hypothetical protein
MHTFRRLFAWHARDASSRVPTSRVIALLLIVILPGGLMVPIFCGLYGAIRHTLTGKAGSRDIEATALAPAAEDASFP